MRTDQLTRLDARRATRESPSCHWLCPSQHRSRPSWWLPPATTERLFGSNGYGSKLNHHGTAGFGPCCHLPGFPFWVPNFDPQPDGLG